MNTRHLLIASLLLSSALVPRAALAQNADVDKKIAHDLAVEGYRALQAKDYTTAADRFTRADALYHAPTVLLGLARAQVGLGKLVSAQELYARTAREKPAPTASPAIKKAVLDAQKELDALTPRIPSVVINVKGSDAARVTLDGSEVRVTALGVKQPVDPGKHVINASAVGFAASEVTVSLAEAKSESVMLELKPRQADLPSVAAVAPVAKPSAAAPVVTRTAPAPRAPMTPAQPDASPDHVQANGSTQKMIGFGAVGVGAAGLLVGGITGGLALSKHSDLAQSCPEGHCQPGQEATFQPRIDSYNAMGTISTIGFLAGGALAATGVVLILTTPKKITPQATITPLVGLGYIGAKGDF